MDGPTVVVPATDILSIRYENGKLEVFNTVDGQNNVQPARENYNTTSVYESDLSGNRGRTSSILATFGVGGQFLIHNKDIGWAHYGPVHDEDTVINGTTLGVNIFFIGGSGFTVSAGTDMIFDASDGGGLNFDPMLGLGYVYYNTFYVGGILNAIPKPYIKYKRNGDSTWSKDGFIAPTFVAGYDFNGFLLGGQLSYMRGVMSSINGFKFSLAAGVSFNGFSRNRSNATGVEQGNQRNSSRQSREPVSVPQLGEPNVLQTALNMLPAVPIAGNNLKFQFGGDRWVATLNGENFSAGTVGFEDTDDGSIMTLKQTHIWPGAVGRTAGRIANRIPGGSAVGGALDTAGRIAGALGAIEASGPEIVLEYRNGPPASLRLYRN